MKNLKKGKRRLRVFRILGLVFIIMAIISILSTRSSNQNKQIFQMEANTLVVAETDLQNVVVTQNIPIPEEIKIKMEEEQKAKEEAERLEQERIAEEQRIAEQKRLEEEQRAKEEAEKQKQLEEERRIAKQKSQQVTSRGGEVSRATGTKAEYQNYAHDLCINTYGWSENDFECLVKLWERESNWNPNAHNKSSGAHGIPQSLPASKMASEGDDYYTNGKTQIRWGLKYIQGRYGTPSSAWQHSQNKGWY